MKLTNDNKFRTHWSHHGVYNQENNWNKLNTANYFTTSFQIKTPTGINR